MAPLEVNGRQVVQAGVAAVRVVPSFDELEDGGAGFSLAREAVAIDELAYEGSEEALAHGTVVAVTGRARGWPHAGVLAAKPESDCSVRRSLVGVVNGLAWSTLSQSHLQGGEHEFSTQVRGHRPTDDPAAPLATEPVRRHWGRAVAAELLLELDSAVGMGTSERSFALEVGVPRSTLRHWKARKEGLDADPLLVYLLGPRSSRRPPPPRHRRRARPPCPRPLSLAAPELVARLPAPAFPPRSTCPSCCVRSVCRSSGASMWCWF